MTAKRYLLVAGVLLSMGAHAQETLEQVQHLFNPEGKSMKARWELDEAHRQKTFLVTRYKPVYFLLGNYTNNINTLPGGERPEYTVTNPLNLDPVEFKFQLSFKFKAIQGLFFGYGDLWMAYTQSSRWQLYNAEESRPFRETNYEPEGILVFPLNFKIPGIDAQMFSVSMTHQSNGRNLPVSRSWNRIIFDLGFQVKDVVVHLRPWIRLFDEDDENPSILNYTGRGEVVVAYAHNGHQLSLVGRHSLQTGANSRGSIQFDYAIPVYSSLKLHFQMFHGYGESMIDYNHYQTTVGMGISLIEWQ